MKITIYFVPRSLFIFFTLVAILARNLNHLFEFGVKLAVVALVPLGQSRHSPCYIYSTAQR